MSTPEGKVKQKLDNILKKFGSRVWYFKPVSNGMGKHGVPDFIVCVRGQFVGIEVKSSAKKKPTGLQLLQLKGIARAEGVAVVAHADNLPEIEQLISELANYDAS